jgi:hypothetical protein
MFDLYLEQFMRHSNMIEREFDEQLRWNTSPHCIHAGALHPRDIETCGKFYVAGEEKKELTPAILCALHGDLVEHMKVGWGGRFRDCEVFVGSWQAAKHTEVPELMATFCEELPVLDPWTAHNRFEKIHPYQDRNGRMGRLIWLYCMARDGKDPFQLPFLHLYYYQTLQHSK